MPRIPIITSSRKLADSANAQAIVRRGPNGFQAASDALSSVAGAVRAFSERDQDQQATASIANFDYTKRSLDRKTEAPADGGDFYAETITDYDQAVDEHVAAIEDDKTRQAVKDKLLARKPNALADAARFQVRSRTRANRDEADTALTAVNNRVRAGDDFNTSMADGESVIDARPLPEQTRNEMKTEFRKNLSNSFFQSQMENARSDEELGALERQLKEEDRWKDLMGSAEFDRTLDAIQTQRRSLRTATRAEASAALEQISGRNTDGVLVPEDEMADAETKVRASGDPKQVAKFYALAAQQDVYRRKSGVRAAELRAAKATTDPIKGLPSQLQTSISEFATPEVSGSYLATLSRLEYGIHLKGEDTDFTMGTSNGTTTAMGVGQFTEGTWMDFARKGLAQLIPADKLATFTDEEILLLRGSPRATMAVTSYMTSQRKAELKGALKRDVSDPETYMTHVLGVGGATTILQAVDAGSDKTAAELQPTAAKNNPPLFFTNNGKGRAFTVEEFHDNIVTRFETAPGRTAHARNEALDNLIRKQNTALKQDPMSYAAETGRVPGAQSPLDFNTPSTIEQRGQAANAVADYYQIAEQDMKPLTVDEEAALSKIAAEGTPEELAGTLAALQAMGPKMASAAYRQIGAKGPVLAHAAGLIVQGGQPETALSVIRGQKRLKENESLKGTVGLTGTDAAAGLQSITAGALSRLPPRQAQTVFDAASAHYADQMALAGNTTGAFDIDQFEKSVNAVMGGPGSVAEVNGAMTVLPAGTTGEQIDEMLDVMSTQDLAQMSDNGQAPVFADGSVVQPEDVASEGKLRAVGRNRYHVEMSDGNMLVTSISERGTAVPYVMVLNSSRVQEVIDRAQKRAEEGEVEFGSGGLKDFGISP